MIRIRSKSGDGRLLVRNQRDRAVWRPLFLRQVPVTLIE